MSRPFRTLFALCLVAFSIGLSACSTIYRPVYTNEKNFFKPPDTTASAKGPQLTAEQVLQATDANGVPTGGAPLTAPDAGGMPPAAPAPAPDAPPATPPPPQ